MLSLLLAVFTPFSAILLKSVTRMILVLLPWRERVGHVEEERKNISGNCAQTITI